MLWVCLSSAKTREVFRIKINGIQLITGKILEENQIQSPFHQTLGNKFQQDTNLKHKDKSTVELLTKMTLNVPEWHSYHFDLNLIENLWQDLNMGV